MLVANEPVAVGGYFYEKIQIFKYLGFLTTIFQWQKVKMD